MKGFPTLIILTALLALTGCGKENESGKNGQNGACLIYGASGCSQYSTLPGGINYGLSTNANISQILGQIPCTYGAMNRVEQVITVPTKTITTAGHTYLGVTSFGDIAILVGNGTMTAQASLYICGGQVGLQAMGPAILGEYATPNCPIKTITGLEMGSRFFRDPRFGSGPNQYQQPFSFCRP